VRNWYLLWRSHLSGRARRAYPRRYIAWVFERALNARAEGNESLVDAMLDAAWDALRGRFGAWQPGRRAPRALRGLVSQFLLRRHPILWIMLLRGEVRAVAVETARRTIRRAM
jgi:hypothetical protein